jgi:hypothetical protein
VQAGQGLQKLPVLNCKFLRNCESQFECLGNNEIYFSVRGYDVSTTASKPGRIFCSNNELKETFSRKKVVEIIALNDRFGRN